MVYVDPPAYSAPTQEHWWVLWGDTQTYTYDGNLSGDDRFCENNADLYADFTKQVDWVIANADSDLVGVVHVGDVTEHDTDAQWTCLLPDIQRLDTAGIPLFSVRGNHDAEGGTCDIDDATCILSGKWQRYVGCDQAKRHVTPVWSMEFQSCWTWVYVIPVKDGHIGMIGISWEPELTNLEEPAIPSVETEWYLEHAVGKLSASTTLPLIAWNHFNWGRADWLKDEDRLFAVYHGHDRFHFWEHDLIAHSSGNGEYLRGQINVQAFADQGNSYFHILRWNPTTQAYYSQACHGASGVCFSDHPDRKHFGTLAFTTFANFTEDANISAPYKDDGGISTGWLDDATCEQATMFRDLGFGNQCDDHGTDDGFDINASSLGFRRNAIEDVSDGSGLFTLRVVDIGVAEAARSPRMADNANLNMSEGTRAIWFKAPATNGYCAHHHHDGTDGVKACYDASGDFYAQVGADVVTASSPPDSGGEFVFVYWTDSVVGIRYASDLSSGWELSDPGGVAYGDPSAPLYLGGMHAGVSSGDIEIREFSSYSQVLTEAEMRFVVKCGADDQGISANRPNTGSVLGPGSETTCSN